MQHMQMYINRFLDIQLQLCTTYDLVYSVNYIHVYSTIQSDVQTHTGADISNACFLHTFHGFNSEAEMALKSFLASGTTIFIIF